MKKVLVILFALISISCKQGTSVEFQDKMDKWDIYYERFDFYLKRDDINDLPNTFHYKLNNKDSVIIHLQNIEGESTYEYFNEGILLEKGSYKSSLGILAKYLTQENEMGQVTYKLYRYYQPIQDDLKIIRETNSNFFGIEK